MPITRTAEDISFLERVDSAYRSGVAQGDIASNEGMTLNGIRWKVRGLGFKFTREGGLRLVDTMLDRDLAEWLGSGELVAATDAEAVPV